jgi:hypothetical protein
MFFSKSRQTFKPWELGHSTINKLIASNARLVRTLFEFLHERQKLTVLFFSEHNLSLVNVHPLSRFQILSRVVETTIPSLKLDRRSPVELHHNKSVPSHDALLPLIECKKIAEG